MLYYTINLIRIYNILLTYLTALYFGIDFSVGNGGKINNFNLDSSYPFPISFVEIYYTFNKILFY